MPEQTHLEAQLELLLRIVRQDREDEIPEPVAEYLFHPDRRWRFDFAMPDLLLAFEAEGGTWIRGRHSRGQGFEDDCEKYNAAALLGWRVFRFTGNMLTDGRAHQTLEDIFA